MYCNNCGAVNEEKANFCVNCGGRMMAATVVVNPAAVMGTPGAEPAQVSPAATQVPAAQMPPAVIPTATPAWIPEPQGPQTSGKAIASLVLGLANGLFLFFFFPLGIGAIVFGHISRSEIAKSAGRLKGSGMALTGLILGYGSIAIIPIMIIAAIAIPTLDGFGSRAHANESAAVGSLRTINTAAISFQAGAPEKGYPASLEAMQAAGLIDSSLAAGEKSGYRFSYTAVDENNDGVMEGYLLNADPLTPGTTGRKHFFSDETGIIRVDSSQMASKESPPIQ